MEFTYKDRQFFLDGKPYTVLSGAMHYFRIPREYWKDRLMKLKECGFNTVETYTSWNLHEKEEGVFDFTGMLDIAAYISLAESLGLNVIVRPEIVNEAGEVTQAAITIGFGTFVATVIDFLLVAMVVFMVVKAMNTAKAKLEKKAEEEAVPPAPPAPSAEEVLLTEIRDLLKNK